MKMVERCWWKSKSVSQWLYWWCSGDGDDGVGVAGGGDAAVSDERFLVRSFHDDDADDEDDGINRICGVAGEAALKNNKKLIRLIVVAVGVVWL